MMSCTTAATSQAVATSARPTSSDAVALFGLTLISVLVLIHLPTIWL